MPGRRRSRGARGLEIPCLHVKGMERGAAPPRRRHAPLVTFLEVEAHEARAVALQPAQQATPIAGDRIRHVRIDIAAGDTVDDVDQLLGRTMRVVKTDVHDSAGVARIARIALAVTLFDQNNAKSEFLRMDRGTQAGQSAADHDDVVRLQIASGGNRNCGN